ncbi:hypothetical protein B0H11DRAFT_2126899 [Mycena galericulata]|nr:hypothetical protein B0H11DRAFT_2126899 [Mycena galericulata]
MDLFQIAPNLTETICSVPRLRGIPQSTIIHLRLRSLILTESYLTLPALESLHVSEMDDTSYPSLTSFLQRSSPPLRPSLENLELESPSEEVQLFIFQYRNKPVHTVHPPHLRSFRLVSSDGAFLDDKIYSGSRNSGCGTHTLNHHLVRLAKQGMNINISTDTKTYRRSCESMRGAKKLMLDIFPRRTFHKSFPCPVYPTLATSTSTL